MSHAAKITLVVALAGLLSVGGLSGCGGQTTKTERITTTESAGAASRGDQSGSRPVDRTTTATTTQTEDDENPPGIIGSAFQFVWAVISFPFRVVGALF